MNTKRLLLLLVVCLFALMIFTSCDMLMTTTNPGGTDIGVGFDLWEQQVASIEKTGVVNGVATYKITLKNGTEETISVGGMTDKGEITSIEKLTEENGVATYKITLSDGTSQTLTVTDKTTPPVTTAPTDDLNNATLEQLLAMLEANKVPILDEGSTVTDASKTTAAGAFKNGVVGFTTYMTKAILFGEDDTLCKITLNDFSFEAVTADDITVYIEFRKINTTRPNDNNAVAYSTVVATYEASVTPNGLGDYVLDLGVISKENLKNLGDAFILGIYTDEDTPVRMSFSKNTTCLMAEKNALTNTTSASFRYSYYYKNVDGNITTVSADEALMPAMTFLHSEEPKYMLESELIEKIKELIAAGGNTGNTGNTGGTVTPGVVPTAGLKLHLPDYYDLVVGDNFELFYKGIVECYNNDAYEFMLRYADYKSNSAADTRGKAFARKYVWTPAATDAGKTYILNITVYDNVGSIVATDSVEIRVHAKPTSPEEEKVVLCVGDSLITNYQKIRGAWAMQLYKRLVGDGLQNIKFIGNSNVDGTDLHYEGNGGWSFSSYNGAEEGRNDKSKYIIGVFTDKNEAEDQHSVYKDSNGTWWKLESIDDKRIRLIYVDGGKTDKSLSASPTTGGTLTWVSGGVNHGDITFTGWTTGPSNPMWDETTNSVNMQKYVESFGVDHLDEVFVLLGWNNTGTTEEKYKESVRTFIDNILSVYPDCHITLLGLQVPLKDGFASNYGLSWPYFEKAGHVWNIQEWNMEICEEAKYKDNLSFVQVSGQFDSVNNHQMTDTAVNNHSTEKETICANALHPADSGYKQIGDAAYRHFVSRLQE